MPSAYTWYAVAPGDVSTTIPASSGRTRSGKAEDSAEGSGGGRFGAAQPRHWSIGTAFVGTGTAVVSVTTGDHRTDVNEASASSRPGSAPGSEVGVPRRHPAAIVP